jgi:tRNA-splicing ligase RtcB
MDPAHFTQRTANEWEIAPHGAMRVPAVIFGSEALIRAMDQKVWEQAVNVATLPGIVKASYAMPDAHWGYGFPIGGVAAFDPGMGGVVSAGGVGFDISCGVRCLHTGLTRADVMPVQKALAGELFARIPAGVGSTGAISLDDDAMDSMLDGGARWAVERGWGVAADLERIEEQGRMADARPGRWARSAAATTTWRCRRSPPSTTSQSPAPMAWNRAPSW